MWGVESNFVERFGRAGVAADKISMVKDTYYFDHAEKTPEQFIETFEAYYGPTMNAVEAARAQGREAELHQQLVALANAHNQKRAGTATWIPAHFLRVTVQV
jgi:hypothetical protein